MDCKKIGALILSLRKEMHMTQKELADAMRLSDRTISKWERGNGCPDITLLKELSDIFGVNIERILSGELASNIRDSGNIKAVKFYVCPDCGNVVYCTGGAEISCYGRKLTFLKDQCENTDHTITLTVLENDYYVEIQHEMSKDHYISFCAYVCCDRILLIKLYPEQSPEVRFPKLYGGDFYIYCTRHGLIKKESIHV